MTPPPPPFYGLGVPVNRDGPMTRTDIAIPGRPNWFRRPDGTEYFREPKPAEGTIPARHTPPPPAKDKP